MSKSGPRFVMRRPTGRAEREALRTGKPIRSRGFNFEPVIYVPVRIKPRYWTSQTLAGSVIHIATGRGVREEGSNGPRGEIAVEPHCYGHLEWPRALSSPADFPERRLCTACLSRAHAMEPDPA